MAPAGYPQCMRRSVAVILSTRGTTLDLRALGAFHGGRIVHAAFARGEIAACATATVEHESTPDELLATLKSWAAARGWRVSVAPLVRESIAPFGGAR